MRISALLSRCLHVQVTGAVSRLCLEISSLNKATCYRLPRLDARDVGEW